MLQHNAPEVRLANRDNYKAIKLAAELSQKIQPYNWSARSELLSGARILINTTSLGMKGQPKLEIDLVKLPSNAIVYDIVYNPIETQLLTLAKKRGNETIDGLGMLLHQAKPGFAQWFGVDPEVSSMLRKHIISKMRR